MVYPWVVVIGIGVGIAGILFALFQDSQNRERHQWHSGSTGSGGGADVGPNSMWDSPSNISETRPIPRRRRLPPPNNGSCIICLDQISEDSQDIETLNCNHSFHSMCIKKWFEEKRQEICPVCRNHQ